MRRAAIRHDASTYMHGRIVTDSNATHEKRIRVGRALLLTKTSIYSSGRRVTGRLHVGVLFS